MLTTCAYCGRENDHQRTHCRECGTELAAEAPAQQDFKTTEETKCNFCGIQNPSGRVACSACGNNLAPPEYPTEDQFHIEAHAPDISGIELQFVEDNGFSYPDWSRVDQSVRSSFSRSEWDAVYRQLVRCWLRRLREDLGGHYCVYESTHFVLLCAEGRGPAESLLKFAEGSLTTIKALIGPVLSSEVYGKRALLVLSDLDDYYSYIAHFYPEGEHPQSAGVFLNAGYAHIAFPFHSVYGARQVLIHELVHNCLFHLPVPTWLNEGLSQRIEHTLVGQPFQVDGEMVERHSAHWNEQNLQAFWAGTAFGDPESSQLCYELAEVLVEVLAARRDDFLAFVRAADWRDAGQDAAQRTLGQCLGETVGGFLGPGDWRPNRKHIATLTGPASSTSGECSDRKEA